MTINAALPHLKSGDTLFVREGEYRESIYLRKASWGEYPAFPAGVSFKAYPGERVMLKGSDVVGGWMRFKDSIWVKEKWDVNSQQAFCDGKILQQIGGKMCEWVDPPEGKSYCKYWLGRKGSSISDMEPGSFFYDLDAKKLYVWLNDGGDPNTHMMEVSARRHLLIVYCDGTRISGFKMTHSTGSAYEGTSPVEISGSNNLLENSEITWCDYVALLVGGSNNTVSKCKLNNNGNSGIGGYGWGNRILNCEMSFNNYRHWSSAWHAGGLKVIPFAHDWIVSDCIAEGNFESPGIWFDGNMANVTIQNCKAFHNGGTGIFYEIGERGIIKNNICYENMGRGIGLSDSSYCAVLHNICYKNGMSGIVCTGVQRDGDIMSDETTGIVPARNNLIWGNILMDNCNPELCPKGKDGTGGGWELRPELIVPDPSIPSNTGTISDYNIFYRSDDRPTPFWYNWGSKSYNNLADWQKGTGLDKHSIMAKPLFADLSKYDFRPVEGSPAIQFVHPVMGIRYDMNGIMRNPSNLLYTAGPIEADAKLLKALPKVKKAEYAFLPIPAPMGLAELPATVALCEALKELPATKDGLTLKDTPFSISGKQGTVLFAKSPKAIIPVGRNVKSLSLAFALTGADGKSQQFKLRIIRDDGAAVDVATGNAERAWESKDSAQAVFTCGWKNDNPWYPVREIQLSLENPAATVVILGVTAQSVTF